MWSNWLWNEKIGIWYEKKKKKIIQFGAEKKKKKKIWLQVWQFLLDTDLNVKNRLVVVEVIGKEDIGGNSVLLD